MRITSAEFVTSAVAPDQYPPGIGPEIAFVGRSNVGKSSLINTLLNRHALAKISGTPGKTRTINFFHVNQKLGFVDLPGYGFAHVSRTERATWGPMVARLFQRRRELVGVIQLLDVRHRPSVEDQNTRSWLLQWNLPMLLVATKVDKIGRPQRSNHLTQIAASLSLTQDTLPVLFSAHTGEGREKIWDWIRQTARF